MIVKDRRVVHRVTSNDNEWQRMTTSGTTNGIEWYKEWQRVTTSGTASDNEWKNEWIRMRVSKIEWFHVAKETKGQSGRPISFRNNFIESSMQYITTVRTSSSQMFFKIGVYKVYNIYRKYPRLCWSLLLVKL